MGRALVLQHDADGLSVVEAPASVVLTKRFLGMVDAGMLPGITIEAKTMTIAATNGTWTYHLGTASAGVTPADLTGAPA